MISAKGLRYLLPVLLAMALPSAAMAQPDGPYLGLGLGANILSDADVSGTGINQTAEFNAGWIAAGTFGYKWNSGVRAEFEGGYRENSVDRVSGATTSYGTGNALSFMGNLLYDFADEGSVVTPYVGAGFGGAIVGFSGVAPIGGASVDETDTVLAYQAIAGLSVALFENLQLFADYRYFATGDPKFTTAAAVPVDSEYGSHTVLVGLRWSFVEPPRPPRPAPKKYSEPMPRPAPAPAPAPAPVAQAVPAPAPAPAPAPTVEIPRSYLVFFDWDKADLTPEALDILRIAAKNAKTAAVTRIVLTGHADRSGPAAYNMRLSKRRAVAVRQELQRLGISKSEMAVFAKGETDPLVPTPDGVREPQNRRVQIVFE